MTKVRQSDGLMASRLAYALAVALLFLAAPVTSAPVQPTASVLTEPGPANDALPAVPSQKPIAVWDTDVRIALDGGYRENVLRSSVAPEETGFIHSTAELSFIRLSESGTEYSLFALAEDWRYPDCGSVSYEQLGSATAQGLWPIGERQEFSTELQYFYQHQVLDLSETDTELRRLLVKGHSIYARPKWRFNFDSRWAVQAELSAMRQIYSGSLVDDYWEPAAKTTLFRKYGNRSEASGYLQIANRRFDTWEQYDRAGKSIPNTELEYWRPEIGGQIRHFWDKNRYWRTLTRVSYLWNQDNGTGYFDFGRLLVSQQIRWQTSRWQIRGGARVGWYEYENQRVAGDNRYRSYVIADARVERHLGKHLFLFAAGEKEWDFSNDPLDEYEDSWAGGGLGLDF